MHFSFQFLNFVFHILPNKQINLTFLATYLESLLKYVLNYFIFTSYHRSSTSCRWRINFVEIFELFSRKFCWKFARTRCVCCIVCERAWAAIESHTRNVTNHLYILTQLIRVCRGVSSILSHQFFHPLALNYAAILMFTFLQIITQSCLHPYAR